MKTKKNGFTFVELLVVVTIIAVITGIAVASYQATNKKARDTRRKSDLEQVRAALELCRSEAGSYPDALDFTSEGNTLLCDDGQVYLDPLPLDPRFGQAGYGYTYERTTTTTYDLCVVAWEVSTDDLCIHNP